MGVLLVFVVFMLGMYVLPTIVAAVRKHRQLAPIALLNLVLGWSVIGWIAAMVWSLTSQQPQQTIIVQQAPPQS
ncbi:MAG: superinfection immunity protein [Devosia sp.]|nr:superinfection immunity protein [Devosia sp.]